MKIVQKTPDWIGAKGVCGFCNCEVELEECDGLPISKENPLYKLGDYWVGQELLKIKLSDYRSPIIQTIQQTPFVIFCPNCNYNMIVLANHKVQLALSLSNDSVSIIRI